MKSNGKQWYRYNPRMDDLVRSLNHLDENGVLPQHIKIQSDPYEDTIYYYHDKKIERYD